MSTAIGPHRNSSRLTVVGLALLAGVLVAVLVDRSFFGGTPAPAGTGSGIAATQARAVPRFRDIELAGDNNVIVQVGPRQSVVVHADDNLLTRVTTRVRSGRLVIGSTPGNLSARSPMFVTVRLPSLDRLRLTGDGNIEVTGVSSEKLTVALAGSGNIAATGATTKLDITISGEGTALLRELSARDATAAISGDGSIMLTAMRSLSAKISGNGTILYGGNPSRLAQTVTGNGTITAG
jgi:hypothetical protein